MRAQHHRPRIQNGPVARRQTRSKAAAVSKAFGVSKSSTRGSRSRSTRASRYHQPRAERGSKIMWLMILTGAILAAGFVFALRSHINAYQLGQAEEELRATLDEYAGEQKRLMLDQQRALSANESERAGRQAGLSQLRLNQPNTMRVSSSRPAATSQKASITPKTSASSRPAGALQRKELARAKKEGGNQRQAARSQPRR